LNPWWNTICTTISGKNILKNEKKGKNQKPAIEQKSDLYQIVRAVPHPDLFRVPHLPLPVCLRMDTLELVPPLVVMGSEQRIRVPLLLVHEIETCRIYRDRVL
jgi:hypothetical protein